MGKCSLTVTEKEKVICLPIYRDHCMMGLRGCYKEDLMGNFKGCRMGKGTLESPVPFSDQKYKTLRNTHLKQKSLFCDPVFGDVTTSIGSFPAQSRIEWKRPRDLCPNPHFFARDVTAPEDIIAGQLSTPWFVAAITVLAGIGEILYKVVPGRAKQEWDPEGDDNYAGIFHFRFWRFGKWIDVVIDDKLPVLDTRLLTAHSVWSSEFWISLLEKAYVKLHGSYDALAGGHLANALVDFTGGVSEIMDLKSEDYRSLERQSLLFSVLATEMNHSSILCASVVATNDTLRGLRTDIGLYIGHAYCVTSVKRIHLGESSIQAMFRGHEKISMVRLRGPGEPSGKVARDEAKSSETENVYTTSKLTRLMSKNPHWSKIQDSERYRLGLNCDTEGEFWMPMEDFVANFTELVICRTPNTNIFAMGKTWREASVQGEWTTGVKGSKSDRAGGSVDFPDTFFRNPQFLFDIKEPDEIMIQMLQWDTGDRQPGLPSHLITFYVIKVEENRKYRLKKQWDFTPTVICFNPIRKRELYYNGRLPQGRYIIMPTTHKPGENGAFYIRIFTSSNINLRSVNKDRPKAGFFGYRYPVWVTVVYIKGAENLKQFNRTGTCDAFCKIDCEGNSGRTVVLGNSLNPTWNASFVFYRKKMDSPIRIRVFHHKVCLSNNFAGQVLLPAPLNQQPTPLELPLMDKKVDDPSPTQGKLIVVVYTTDNFMLV
ncbi:calpain-5 isoform X2 [Anabrus simplex]|uniref:calpain-5 isoform X2 n=1 Tax=Anabrus simplex TaxID=316456 RepID=UPI0035A2CCE2